MNVIVTGHASQQARERRHFPHCRHQELVDRIRAEVADAFENGRVSERKPEWARRWHERRKPIGAGVRCVWNAEQDLAWVVGVNGETVTVITCLHRVNAGEAAA